MLFCLTLLCIYYSPIVTRLVIIILSDVIISESLILIDLLILLLNKLFHKSFPQNNFLQVLFIWHYFFQEFDILNV